MIKFSCEEPKKFYVCLFGKRYIFEGWKYVGKYDPNLDHVLD